MHGFEHGEDYLKVGRELIGPINFSGFIQTIRHAHLDIADIEEKGLRNGIGQVKNNQAPHISQTQPIHHHGNRNHDNLERNEDPQNQQAVHNGKSLLTRHIAGNRIGCCWNKEHDHRNRDNGNNGRIPEVTADAIV